MPNLMKVVKTIANTADATTFKTAGIALPTHAQAVWQFVIVNRGSIELQVKVGPASGPDASNATDAYPCLFVPAGQTHAFSRSQDDTHVYLYAASNCLFAIECGSGE